MRTKTRRRRRPPRPPPPRRAPSTPKCVASLAVACRTHVCGWTDGWHVQVAKKHLMETVLPIVLSLKNTFERLHSPLTQHVMMYLREVTKDYKEEMDGAGQIGARHC